MLPVHGLVARGFAGVRDAFVSNLEHHGDVGAACAVYRDGKPVVDIWAGFADLAGGRPWVEDTVQSTQMKFDPAGDDRTKGLVASVYKSLR